jgi:hypothetical protein
MRDLYMLKATTPNGLTVLTGPMPIVEAMKVTDEHLTPNDWQPRYLPVTPHDLAVRQFTIGAHRRRSRPGADFFATLRRAIICDPDRDGLDDYVTRGVLAHVDPHRPLQMWTGDEDCWHGECDHPSVDDEHCEGITRAEQLCVACTAIIDTGSEFGPAFACRVEWPCAVIVAAAGQYKVPLGAEAALR